MPYVRYIDSPKVNETVGFTLETYDNSGLLKNPYVVERVTIYRIENNPSKNRRVLKLKHTNSDLEGLKESLLPTEENIERLKTLQMRMDDLAQTQNLFYSEARIVMQTISPIWTSDGKVQHIANLQNDKKEVTEGKFLFIWVAKNVREGTYLIRWTWRDTKDGNVRTAEKLFTLYPAEQKINSIYSKFVPREKYDFLFERYIPKMYRVKTTLEDRTPEILGKLNKSVGQMLLELDDLAVGLIDLLDPTFMPEGFLPIMANFFNIELKSTSTAAWRSQIRNAVPLFKKKGTLEGLQEALDKCGIRLLKLTNLWQIISPYRWVDGFVIEKDIGSNSESIGYLSKKPIKKNDLKLFIKSAETKEYFELPANLVYLQDILVPEPKTAVIWNGSAHNPPIELFKGDVVRVRYSYNTIPNDAQSLENYVEGLPLADSRDETKVKYPLKNWNVRLIEEDDPFFDLLVPERHAFHNPITYGKIRTTFLYSEKAFNMDTYNGSLYNSNNPCDMDKDFIDICSGGQSSKFNVHLQFDQVDDEKILEAKDIIVDFSPFHAVLNNIKISSRIFDFVLPPTENIKSEVKTSKSGDKVGCTEAIYCKIKHKDGKIEQGRLV